MPDDWTAVVDDDGQEWPDITERVWPVGTTLESAVQEVFAECEWL